MRHPLSTISKSSSSFLASLQAPLSRPRHPHPLIAHTKPRLLRAHNTMAITGTINIGPDNTGLWHIKQSDAAAKKTSELLQKDFETNHVFFNDMGFHNHISHHILALYGTGASAEVLERGYTDNSSYQRPIIKAHDDPAETLRDWETAKKRLGKEQYYTDFLIFFRAEIERLGGWKQALEEYLFKQGDERSLDMLVRMHSGFLHPMLQLMYGVEWSEPTIVAMALAQASVHGDSPYRQLFLDAEEAAAKNYPDDGQVSMPSIVSLFEEVRADEKLAGSAKMSDSNKIRDGVMKRAPAEMMRVLAKVRVRPEELQQRLVEMVDANVYVGAAAAIREGKQPRWDFFLIHHINILPIYIVMNQLDWISPSSKVRLLEWKIRIDLLQYAARACPELSLEKITSYTPKDKDADLERDLVARVHNLDHDDGHAIKLFRAVGTAKQFTKQFAKHQKQENQLQIRDDATWDKVYHLAADAVENGSGWGGKEQGFRWVLGAGDPEAWKNVPDAPSGNGKL